MRRLLSLLIVLICAAPAAAETYYLPALSTEPIGDRWYLMRYGTVTLEPGEVEGFWLSLGSCPGGVDSPAELFVQPTSGGEFVWQKGWWHPVPYNTYQPDVGLTIANDSDHDMTFKLKSSVRCKH